MVEIDHSGSIVGRRDTSLLPGDRLSQIPGTEPPEHPDAGSDQEDKRDREAAKSADGCGSQMRSVRVELGIQFNSTTLPRTHLNGTGY